MTKHKDSQTILASDTSVLTTSLGVVVGTAALVGIHHRYRKHRVPEARLQDYLAGIYTQLQTLTSVQFTQSKALVDSLMQLKLLQYAYRQATSAYQNYDKASLGGLNRDSIDLAAIHTTTMLARPISWVSGVSSMPKIMPLASDKDSCCGVVGIDTDRQIVWQTTMPERVHDIVVQPFLENQCRDVVVMGRRPSEAFWVLDTATGQVKYAIKAAADRHFYGHACYSLDGTQLYVTENDTITLTGKIGVYDVNNNYQKIAEFDSHGIGPHELIMHPDNETLIIANGGIKTEQASRAELNLDTMHPSLVYLNRHDGTLLEQIIPEHNQMSVRHLAMHDNGTVIIGIQFQGEKHINVPLVLTHQRGDTEFKPLIMPKNQWQRFHQYIASVAVDSKNNLLCATTPIGGCAAIYDLITRELIDDVRLLDCAGASVLINETKTSSNISVNVSASASASANTNASANDDYTSDGRSGFIVSDGQGLLTTLIVSSPFANNAIDDKRDRQIIKDSQLHKMAFDNHLQAL